MKHASATAKAAARNATVNSPDTSESNAKALATVEAPKPADTAKDGDTVHAPFKVELEADGETVKEFEAALPQQVGEAILERMKSAEKSGNQAAWLLFRASKVSQTFYNNTLIALNTGELSMSALSNLKSVAERVIPFKLQHGVRAPLSLLKDAVAAVIDRDCTPKQTPEAKAVLEALKDANVTQRAIRDLRKGFDKSGQPVAKALPAPKVDDSAPAAPETAKPAAPAPTGIAGEVRAEREAKEEIASAQPVVAPPVVGKSVDPAKDSRDAAFAAGVILPLKTVAAFVREKSIVDPAERAIITERLREIAKLLQLTLS